MGDEGDSPKQKLTAGNRSHNVQVGRDYHHYAALQQPLIQRATQSDIEKFDPRILRIRKEADKDLQRYQTSQYPRKLSLVASIVKLFLLVLLIGFLIAVIF